MRNYNYTIQNKENYFNFKHIFMNNDANFNDIMLDIISANSSHSWLPCSVGLYNFILGPNLMSLN